MLENSDEAIRQWAKDVVVETQAQGGCKGVCPLYDTEACKKVKATMAFGNNCIKALTEYGKENSHEGTRHP